MANLVFAIVDWIEFGPSWGIPTWAFQIAVQVLRLFMFHSFVSFPPVHSNINDSGYTSAWLFIDEVINLTDKKRL